MPDFGLDQAHQRVLDAMHGGDWERVDAQLTAYAAAVRADERAQALAEALAAVQDCAQEDPGRLASDCLDALRRLQ